MYKKKFVKAKGKSKAAGPLSQAQVKAVAKIAKKVDLATAETKSAQTYNSQTLAANTFYAQNLNYFIAQGTGAGNIIGEKLYLKNMYMRITVDATNTSVNSAKTIRLALVRSKKALTNGLASITASDIFRNDGSASADYGTFGMIDLHKVDLIKDETIVLQASGANAATVSNTPSVRRHLVWNIPINKVHFFDQDNSGYFKRQNYYLVMGGWDATGSINSPAIVTYQWVVNFKDE